MKNTKICIVILTLAIFSVLVQPAMACDLKLVAVVPSADGYKINHIEAMHVLYKDPNTMILIARNQDAYCGGGTPAAVWKLNLKTGKSKLIQSLPLTQTSRGSLFESSDGTLFTGGGWCGSTPPYFSMDNGNSWYPANKGVHPPNSTFSFVEFNGDVYAGTGYDPHHAQVYRWLGNSSSDHWGLVFDILPPRTIIPSGAMVEYKKKLFVGSRVYGAGDCLSLDPFYLNSPVFVTSDAKSFKPVGSGLHHCGTVWHYTKVEDQLIALTSYYDTDAFLHRWANAPEGLQDWEQIGPYPLGLNAGVGFISHFILSNRGALYSYGKAPGDDSKGIYQSINMGKTWEQIAVIENPDVASATIHNDFLYVTTFADEDGTADIYKIYLKVPKKRLLWQDQANGGFWNNANAITSEGNMVFVAGQVEENETKLDFAVRAYHAKTGELIWQDQVNGTGDWDDYANAIVASNNLVFVAGGVRNVSSYLDFTVRAYNCETGTLLWQDQFNGSADYNDMAHAIATKGERVFVAGSVGNKGHNDFAVRTYHAKTGKLLWQDQYSGTGPWGSGANAITVKGERVFVAGSINNIDVDDDFTVRTYNAKTGKLLWHDEYNGSADYVDETRAIAATENHVFVAGNINNIDTGLDFTVRAYQAKTGKLIWQDQVNGTADWYPHDEANAIAVKNGRVFVAGTIENINTGEDFTIRVYHATTGKILWQDQYNGSGGYGDEARAIALKGDRVFAAGNALSLRFCVRVYNAKTGKLLWQDLDVPGSADAITESKNWVFAVGDNFTIRAYEAK